MQFDYGLRQRRYRSLDHRPASFVTGQGKVIKVDKETAVVNEKRLERGKVMSPIMDVS